MNKIRLIVDTTLPGSTNMAIDQALLESTNETTTPTLRFYRWAPATLSLGYFQSLESRYQHSESLDAPLVRRASGGGAIMHHHELTYSIVLPSGDRWSKRNTDLYRLAHDALINVFAKHGIQLQAHTGTDTKARSNDFLCFNRRSDGDLIMDSYKVVGSAQRRSKNALLQHGSILLKRSEFAPQLPGIEDLSGIKVGQTDLIAQTTNAFCAEFGFEAESGELTSDESEHARLIRKERFESSQWTEKKKRTS